MAFGHRSCAPFLCFLPSRRSLTISYTIPPDSLPAVAWGCHDHHGWPWDAPSSPEGVKIHPGEYCCVIAMARSVFRDTTSVQTLNRLSVDYGIVLTFFYAVLASRRGVFSLLKQIHYIVLCCMYVQSHELECVSPARPMSWLHQRRRAFCFSDLQYVHGGLMMSSARCFPLAVRSV